uniref:C-type lectin domain-containing protein n=1 Tax=Caenorhabditis tropicalis TaxID=1561998 RepID=A0A1I7TVR7_9PELO
MFPRRLNAIPEDSETEGDEEEPYEPVIVEMAEEELPIKDFEPVKKQRHFGILHYHITGKFRRMMVIGLVNVILVIVFFLFILFFLELHKDNTPAVLAGTTVKPVTTEAPGWCRGLYTFFHGKCPHHQSAVEHIKAERTATKDGGYLVTMKTKKDIQIVRDFMNSTNGEVFWIGMYCTGNNITDCVWDDATPVEYNNFGAGHPNISQGMCVSYNLTNNRWHSAHCIDALYQIDEMPKNTAVRPRRMYGTAAHLSVFSHPFFFAILLFHL